jgi:hypothetical protein
MADVPGLAQPSHSGQIHILGTARTDTMNGLNRNVLEVPGMSRHEHKFKQVDGVEKN